MANKKSSSKSRASAARKAASSISTKNIIIIAVAAVLIVGLLVVLAYSPVGQAVIDKLGADSTVPAESENNGGSGIKFASIGSDVTLTNGDVVLENVVLSAHFVDVGQGDCIIIQLPDNKTLMIDGGTSTSGIEGYREEVVQTINDIGTDIIDYMVVTHPDTDHYNMLTKVMDVFEVKNVYYNNFEKNDTYTKFIARIKSEVGNASFAIDADGEDYSIETDAYKINMYAPGYETINGGESNGMSVIVSVECAGKKLLFTGDAVEETEKWFAEKMGGESYDVDFLKVGHHGSDTSTSQAFLDYINPEYCVIMCDDNYVKYRHPHWSTMDKLFAKGVVTYRTDRHGDIVLEIDEDGDMAFVVEKEVQTENNTKGRSDLMLRTGE